MFGSPSTKRKTEAPRLPLPVNHGSRQQTRAAMRKTQKKGNTVFYTQYESKTLFAGIRASVGRSVTIKVDTGIRSGAIDGISEQDEISIHSPGEATPRRGLLFVATRTPADVLAMPNLTWTWPPKSSP